MASFRRFIGGSESCWIHSKMHKPESRYVYLPEISMRLPDEFFCTQFNKSASSSTCTSEDSGIARTLNLSPHSPVLGDSDSEDSVSSDGLNASQYTQKNHQFETTGTLKFYPDHDFSNRPGKFNVAESAQFSPRCGMCVAATRDDPGHGDFGEKQSDNRFHIMSFEQVKGLHTLLTDSIPVHSRQPGCPTIWLRLSDLFQAVEENLKACGIPVRDIRINGGAASYILVAVEPGKENHLTNWLSRPEAEDEASRIMIGAIGLVVELDPGRFVQLQDPALRKVATTLLHGRSIENEGLNEAGKVSWNATDLGVVLPVIPHVLRRMLIVRCHKMAHTGYTKTYDLLRQRAYWPGSSEVMYYLASCNRCQLMKGNTTGTTRPMQPSPVSEFGGLCGNQYTVIMTKYLSPWIEAAAVPNQRATTISGVVMHHIVANHGVPKIVLTDRRPCFESEEFRNCLQKLGIRRLRGASHHPQTNGLTERTNRTIKEWLAAKGSDSAPSYNDIDVLISVDLSSQSSTIQRVKSSVLDALMRFLPEDRGSVYSASAFKNGNLSHGTQGQNISPTDGSETDKETNSNRYFSTDFIPTTAPSGSPTPRGTEEEPQQSFAFSPNPICQLNTPLASVSDGYLRESYIYKQFRKYSTHDADCWSLLSLGMPSNGSKVVELKFVDRMRRQFEFTVDSFQISLSPILSFIRMYPNQPLTPNFAPTVVAESVAGSFSMALYHLKNKLIITKEPEMIRGGGLLKYCRLLVNGYQAPNGIDVGSLERYMSSRFFIDFQDIQSQKAKIEAFLTNHFKEDEDVERVNFLRTVHRVVSGSTICLMSFERYQTLHLICQLIDQYAKQNPIPSSAPSLDWFANQQNLTVDTIFYGTQYFPIISCGNSPRFSCCHWEQKSPRLCCEGNEVRFSLGPSSSSSDSEFSPKYSAKGIQTSVDCPVAETFVSVGDIQKSCSPT
ncbi:hypothetical protein T265_06697 [Opisthorchis viverrini]|uniref:polynucleotide adenylyltransferase n=1 Tax=Opisthorchis viverrini TaxID=6198 RepID=A0A074ZF83_OPIVI|nr:hypothetical protein T265_06697 [Opisthorchis viverrini]KER25946.1 hypothetical protein T265_06697 [Opisthorchis viverrini]